MSDDVASVWDNIEQAEQLPRAERYAAAVQILTAIPDWPEFAEVRAVTQLLVVQGGTEAQKPVTEYWQHFQELVATTKARPEYWHAFWTTRVLTYGENLLTHAARSTHIPPEDVITLLADFDQITTQYNLPGRLVEYLHLAYASFSGGHSAIQSDFVHWQDQKRTDLCICESCELSFVISHFMAIADAPNAAKATRSALKVLGPCTEHPHNMVIDGVHALLLDDDVPQARSLFVQALHQAEITQHTVGLAAVAAVAAQTHQRGIALHIVSNYALLAQEFASTWDRGLAYAYVGYVCSELEQAGHGGALVNGIDGNFTTISELCKPLTEQVAQIAGEFDDHYQSVTVGDQLRHALNLDPLPAMSLGAVGRPIPGEFASEDTATFADEWPALTRQLQRWGAPTTSEREAMWRIVGDRLGALQQSRADGIVDDKALFGQVVSAYLAVTEPALSYDVPPRPIAENVLTYGSWLAELCEFKKWRASAVLIRLHTIVLQLAMHKDLDMTAEHADLGAAAMELQSVLSDGHGEELIHPGADAKYIRLGIVRMMCILADQSFLEEHSVSLLADVQASMTDQNFAVQRAALLLYATASRDISDFADNLSIDQAMTILELARDAKLADVEFYVGCTVVRYYLQEQDSPAALAHFEPLSHALRTGRATGLWGTAGRYALITNIFDAAYYGDADPVTLHAQLSELAELSAAQGDFPGAHFMRLYLAVWHLHSDQPADALELLRRVTTEAEPTPSSQQTNLGVYRVWFLASLMYSKELLHRDHIEQSTQVALQRLLVSRGQYPDDLAPFIPAVTAETLAHLAVIRPLGEAKALLWAHEGCAVVEQYLRDNEALLVRSTSIIFSALWREERHAHGDAAAVGVFDRWSALLKAAKDSDIEQEQWVTTYFGLGTDVPFESLEDCWDNYHLQRTQFFLMSGQYPKAVLEAATTIDRCQDRVDADLLLGVRRYAIAATVMADGFDAGKDLWAEYGAHAWQVGGKPSAHAFVYSVGAMLHELGCTKTMQKSDEVWAVVSAALANLDDSADPQST